MGYYLENGFIQLKFEEESSFKKKLLPHIIAKSWGIDLVDISPALEDMSDTLYYMFLRMDIRHRYYNEDLHEMFELTRSTMKSLWPIIEDFNEKTLSPAVREVEDPEILDRLFNCQESLGGLNLIHNHLKDGILHSYHSDFAKIYRFSLIAMLSSINYELKGPRSDFRRHPRLTAPVLTPGQASSSILCPRGVCAWPPSGLIRAAAIESSQPVEPGSCLRSAIMVIRLRASRLRARSRVSREDAKSR